MYNVIKLRPRLQLSQDDPLSQRSKATEQSVYELEITKKQEKAAALKTQLGDMFRKNAVDWLLNKEVNELPTTDDRCRN